MYFLKDVKKQGNKAFLMLNNGIQFYTESNNVRTLENKYNFKKNDNCIYLNDNIKIAENIENCIFYYDELNGKGIIKVKIKVIDGEERTIEYVLSDESFLYYEDK